MENIYKVRLVNQNLAEEFVKFDVSPEISEARSVNYAPLEPVHSPGQIYIYKNTQSRNFELGDIKLISRSSEEAYVNMVKLQRIRSWTLPWFGGASAATGGATGVATQTASQYDDQIKAIDLKLENLDNGDLTDLYNKASLLPGNPNKNLDKLVAEGKNGLNVARQVLTEQNTPPQLTTNLQAMAASSIAGLGIGGEELGSPPAVLLFSAYSSGRVPITNLKNIPVVISNLNIQYPTDVDYIPALNSEPFPTIMSISISLLESHAPTEFEAFSLMDYKEGNLPGF